jgi:uncharacterized repeat protein (TIGR01451 family)
MSTRWRCLILACGFAGSLGLADPVFAKDAVVVTQAAEKEIEVTTAQGTRTLARVPVERAVPGETVIYTVKVANTGAASAEKVTVNSLVPTHMRYVDGSATTDGAKVLFSVDGGKRFDDADKLTVVAADGRRRPAGPSDFTNIRWILSEPLPAGGQRVVAFRAILD